MDWGPGIDWQRPRHVTGSACSPFSWPMPSGGQHHRRPFRRGARSCPAERLGLPARGADRAGVQRSVRSDSDARFDLIISNPLVTSDAMAAIPQEYRHEAGHGAWRRRRRSLMSCAGSFHRLAGISHRGCPRGGSWPQPPLRRIGLPSLPMTWLSTSDGDDRVFLLTREQLQDPDTSYRCVRALVPPPIASSCENSRYRVIGDGGRKTLAIATRHKGCRADGEPICPTNGRFCWSRTIPTMRPLRCGPSARTRSPESGGRCATASKRSTISLHRAIQQS